MQRSGGNLSSIVLHFRRDTAQPARKLPPFSIVGQHSDHVKDFVQHVALLASECELTTASQVPVWHMGPPIHVADSSASTVRDVGKCRADLAIEIQLTSDERNSMLHWRAKVEKERRPSPPFHQYTIAPSILWVRSELGKKLYRRFSCAGFVTSCYASAGIIIVTSESELPHVSIADVERAYPQIKKVTEMSDAVKARLGFSSLADLGISGDGPWRITLAGYLFHSFKRLPTPTARMGPHAPSSVAEAYCPEK